MKLLSFGEIIWDVFPDGAHIGGAPLNFAAHTVLQGGKASILSSVGNDSLGSLAKEQIAKLGVGTECISVSPDKPTGQCVVSLDQNGVPSYDLRDDTAYDHIDAPDAAEGFDVLAFGTLSLRHSHNLLTLKSLLKKGVYREIFSDLNIRAPFYSKESICFCLENATIVKISDEEMATVTKAALGQTLSVEASARAIAKKYPQIKTVIITLGAKGAYAYDATADKDHRCGITDSPVVSTVGAGDSFGAAFLYWYLSGRDIPACLDIASKVSGFVVSREGAVPTYDIDSLIQLNKNKEVKL